MRLHRILLHLLVAPILQASLQGNGMSPFLYYKFDLHKFLNSLQQARSLTELLSSRTLMLFPRKPICSANASAT